MEKPLARKTMVLIILCLLLPQFHDPGEEMMSTIFCLWLDSSLIHIFHIALVSPHRIWLRNGAREKIIIINILRLFSIRLYNKHMGGVDIILHFKAFVAHAFINTGLC